MTDQVLSFDEFDDLHAPERQQESEFQAIVSRRSFLKGTSALGLTAFVAAAGLPSKKAMAKTVSGLSFQPVAANSTDDITVPSGFTSQVVVRWGDPLVSGVAEFDHATRGSAATQLLSWGDNNDGMDMFVVDDGRMVLVCNHEYTNLGVTFGNNPDGKPVSDDDVNKGKAAHGLAVVELAERNGQWDVVKDSPYNRRITPDSEFEVVGPARGSDLIKTAADPEGVKILGTFNNCGNGSTPWGTYLACEENFNSYFRSSEGEAFQQTAELKRYGVAPKGKERGYNWAQTDERFDVSKHPNEPNRHGWVVEVDPTGRRMPKKLTALGRFKHENAEVTIAKDGRAVVYLGDDERGEFLYKFVSVNRYVPGGDNWNLLDEGELFVAKFDETGRGEWVSLNGAGMSADETMVFARMAASKVGATSMDRPEWVAAHPKKAEAYVALTNNSRRGTEGQAVNAANPREKNVYGHIVRWIPDGGDHAANTFKWDFYVMAGNPTIHSDVYAGSSNITPDNMFNSPDGIKFDSEGNLWIQTDGNYSNAKDYVGMGNNQMLLGDTETGEIHRFMVGPNECEITGLTWSPDKRTMFVGIQHPGEKNNSHWPDGGNLTPRSAVVAVRRTDGGLIG